MGYIVRNTTGRIIKIQQVRARFGTLIRQRTRPGLCHVFEQDLAFISQEEMSLPCKANEEMLVLARIQAMISMQYLSGLGGGSIM